MKKTKILLAFLAIAVLTLGIVFVTSSAAAPTTGLQFEAGNFYKTAGTKSYTLPRTN